MNQWVQLNSIPKGAIKPGQICSVYGVPVEWISAFPAFSPTNQYLQGNISLISGKSWIKFTVAASQKGFDETSKSLKGRKYWEHQVVFRMNWQSGYQHVVIDNMLNSRWVLVIKEGNTGLQYVVGKPPVGCELTASYSNKEGTITDFKAAFQALHRAPLYQGSIGSIISSGVFASQFTSQFG